MAETEQLHKGWLYARDKIKFAPNTLSSSIYTQSGELWGSIVDSKINVIDDLEEQIQNVGDRTSDLESRTQYMNASASSAFYVTDASGNIIAQIDKNGVSSIDFVIPNVTSLQALSDYLANVNLYDSNVFYITDASGRIIFQVDNEGAKSINFTTYDSNGTKVADLNATSSQLGDLEAQYDITVNTTIPAISNRTSTLESRTQYMNASASNTFYVTDASGNIVSKIDSEGVKSLNFISYSNETTKVTDLNSVASALGDLEPIVDNLGQRVPVLEARTQYMNANARDAFYITDEEGNIIMQVNADGLRTTRVRLLNNLDCIGYQIDSYITM